MILAKSTVTARHKKPKPRSMLAGFWYDWAGKALNQIQHPKKLNLKNEPDQCFITSKDLPLPGNLIASLLRRCNRHLIIHLD